MQFDLHRPKSIEEALTLSRQTGGSYLAGGTVLLVNHHRGADIGSHLISLEGIPALHGIRQTDEGIVIGACTTLDEIENSTLLREKAFAAYRAGIREIIIPKENVRDIQDIPKEIREKLQFHPVTHFEEVLRLGLMKEKA